MTEFKIPERHFAGSLYESKSKAYLCTFLRLALWIPCTSTLISTIKIKFLSTWPGLTKQLIQKFLQNPRPQQKGTFENPTKENNRHIPRNQMKRRVKTQLARTVFFYKRLVYQETFTRIKPADSPSHPAVVSNTSWSHTTTTPTQYLPNP